MIKQLIVFLFLFSTLFANAQETTQPQMADNMRAEGKIYVVIAVMSTIFICVAAYLVMIDRKIKKIEKELKNNTSTGSVTNKK